MNRFSAFLLIGALASATVWAQGPRRARGEGRPCAQAGTRAPVADNPVVEWTGKIARVQIARGQGMPYLEVDQNGQNTRVLLGSMRYLMQQNFNPKAGDHIAVKGYKTTGGDVIAISVTSPGQSTLVLRDENGWPVWSGRMGRMGHVGRMGRGGRGACADCPNCAGCADCADCPNCANCPQPAKP